MGKLIIGLLTGVVIGVVALSVMQPKGTVEWHKREYLAAMDRAAKRTWLDKLRPAYAWITQTKADPGDRRVALFEKLKKHENHLVALGFLQAKEIPHKGFEIALEDGTTVVLGRRIHKSTHEVFDVNGLTRRYDNRSPYARSIPDGLVTIAIGTADDISKLEKMVRDEEASRREEVLRNFEADRLEGRK